MEQNTLTDFVKLAVWVDQRAVGSLKSLRRRTGKSHVVVRDHSAFLNSYAPQDEGLYDDAAAR